MPFAPDELSMNTVKGFVDRLMRSQKKTPAPVQWPPKRAQAQETVAHTLGFASWHALQKALSEQPAPGATPKSKGSTTPTLVLPGHVWCTGPHDFVQVNRRPATQIQWNDLVGNFLLTGSPANRHITLHNFAQDGAGTTPVLWLRSNLAAHYNEPTSGLPLVSTQSHDLYSVIDLTLQSCPADICEQMLMGLLDGDEPVWRGRAQSMLSPVLKALVHMRDTRDFKLDAGVLRWRLHLDGVEALAQTPGLPDDLVDNIRSYLRSIPHYKPGAQKQADQTLDMHGYVQMQFTKTLGIAEDLAAPLSMAPRQILAIDEISGSLHHSEKAKWGLISATIDLWLQHNQSARLLFDGFLPNSRVFELIRERLPQWNKAGVLVLVGGQDESMIPLDWTSRAKLGSLVQA